MNVFSHNDIEKRYPGGSDAVRILIQKNLKYPQKAHKKDIVGTSISLVQLLPNGDINISVLNSLGPEIDNEVISVLKITESNWLPINDTTRIDSFYFQIVFCGSLDFSSNPSFHREKVKMNNLLGKVFIVGYNEIQSDESIINKLNMSLKGKNYIFAILHLNELIRRNPYYKPFYQMRINCKKKLDYSSDEILSDLNMITNFLNNLDYQID